MGNRTPTFSACTYAEGLNDALRAARKAGDEKRIEKYSEVLDSSARFALNLQYDEESTYFYTPETRKKILGAFPSSLTDNRVRVDYVQHCVSAFSQRLLYS